MSPITTHVLDTALGRPAAGIVVVLEQQTAADDAWTELARGQTNADGRIANLLPPGSSLAVGNYRLRFLTASYLASSAKAAFYPEVPVQFHLSEPTAHYHIPLLLSPFGYSTYRGS